RSSGRREHRAPAPGGPRPHVRNGNGTDSRPAVGWRHTAVGTQGIRRVGAWADPDSLDRPLIVALRPADDWISRRSVRRFLEPTMRRSDLARQPSAAVCLSLLCKNLDLAL